MLETKEKRPNCYECRYRRTIPGDAHSRCAHPEVEETGISNDWFEAFAGKACAAQRKLGIRGGGLTWPVNFNPLFLTACRGFRSKNDGKKEKSCRR